MWRAKSTRFSEAKRNYWIYKGLGRHKDAAIPRLGCVIHYLKLNISVDFKRSGGRQRLLRRPLKSEFGHAFVDGVSGGLEAAGRFGDVPACARQGVS